MLINAILYILSFIAIIYYILIWTQNNQKLKEYILQEKQKIRENWSKYKSKNTLSALKEAFTDNKSYKPTREYCNEWTLPTQDIGPYNDTETNEYAHLDKEIYNKSNGANINPQQLAKEKLERINSIISNALPEYKQKITELLTHENMKIFMSPPEYVKINIAGIDNKVLTRIDQLNKYIDDPFTLNIISPENRTDILKNYPTDSWINIYSKIQLIKYNFNDNVNNKISDANPNKYSYTYLEISNVPDPNNDPIKGTSYYPSDRTYLNAEAQRRNFIQRELDKKVLTQQEYNDKWSWVDKIGQKLNIPADFNINSKPDTILDVQTRSVMDILTDYDPSQFGCQRIYQECSIRKAPGFALDAYNYEKYDAYLDSLKSVQPTNSNK